MELNPGPDKYLGNKTEGVNEKPCMLTEMLQNIAEKINVKLNNFKEETVR